MLRAMFLLTALAAGSSFGAPILVPAQPTPPSYTIVTIPLLRGFTQMNPQALNNNGDVVGTTTGSLASHTFLYRKGKVRDLGTLGSPIGINALGEIIGSKYLYQGGNVILPPTFGSFVAINDIGQSVGIISNPAAGENRAGISSSFLRQPNETIVILPSFSRSTRSGNSDQQSRTDCMLVFSAKSFRRSNVCFARANHTTRMAVYHRSWNIGTQCRHCWHQSLGASWRPARYF
jgi:probable HAF family extracellular repeat protein